MWRFASDKAVEPIAATGRIVPLDAISGVDERNKAMTEPSQSLPQGMLCPACRISLVMSERQGIEIDYCPQCRGVWLDRGELDKIIERSAREYAAPQPATDNPGNQGASFIPPSGSGPWGAPAGAPAPSPSYPPGQSYPPGYGSGHDRHGDHGGNHGGHGGGGSYGGHGRRGFLGRIFD